MQEQLKGSPNLDPIAAEAIKPYEDLARGFIEAKALQNDETPEEFSAYLDEVRSAPESGFSWADRDQLATLDNIAEVGQEAAASSDFKPQSWQRDYLAAVEAKTNKTKAVVEMDYTMKMEEPEGREKITGILHTMSRERHDQAATATDPTEKSRLNRESRELSRLVSLRDRAAESGQFATYYDSAANEYYQTCKASGETDRAGRELVTDQINHDTLFAKYMPEAVAQYKADEQEQAPPQPEQVDFLSPEQLAAEKAKIEGLNVSSKRRAARSETATASTDSTEQVDNPETEHDQALRDKAAAILREARTSQEWKELGDRRFGEDGLNSKILEERRQGIANGPAAQEARSISEIEKNQYFHTKIPEDIPKMFGLLGLTSDEMQQRAEDMATSLRNFIHKTGPGKIPYCNIGFSKNNQTGNIEPGMQMFSDPDEERYIDQS
jgi:hypothetical protein